MRTRLIHDGESQTVRDAILLYKLEAEMSSSRFKNLPSAGQEALLNVLPSL